MKKFMYVVLMVMVLGAFAGCSAETEKAAEQPSAETKEETKVIRIGVSQLVEHPSLDAIREGIYAAIKDGGYIEGENLEIEYLNSQGSIENTNTIANEFADGDFDLVIGITTPSTQALFNRVKDTPIVYSGLTDPAAAGLEGDNITGVRSMTPVKKQLELMMELLPETKSVGMIYNSGELNSEIQVNLAKEVAQELGLNLEIKAITNSNEVTLALDAILDNVDALYVQQDNTVASAFPVVVKKANEKNVPIIGAVKDFVDQGALATDGPSEFGIGYQTGEMVVRILNGESISDIPMENASTTKRDYNGEAAKLYGIELPADAEQ